MSRSKKVQKIQYRTGKDKKQTRFNPVGKTELKRPPKITIEQKHSMTMQFACPFCLGLHTFQQYLMSTKKGIHQGLAQCPECNNKCRFSTLTKAMTPEEYADYIYGQVRSGIWQKMPFNKWKDRLYKLGWSHGFWKRYKELKSQDTDSEDDDDLFKAQEEWARKRENIEDANDA